MTNSVLSCAFILFLMPGFVSEAVSAEHQVLMLDSNDSAQMVFEPSLLRVAVGDTVTFIPTDWGHNAESIAGLSPQGSTSFYGKMDEPITITLEKEGVYAVQCNPHSLMGMVAVIVAGAATNLEKIRADSSLMNKDYRMKGERLQALFAQISKGT
ncbi:MAG: pseudoazurin [Oceanospirillaceae bacterium]|nr:pseudoazurin [Oceanospirillaceae bacterium]